MRASKLQDLESGGEWQVNLERPAVGRPSAGRENSIPTPANIMRHEIWRPPRCARRRRGSERATWTHYADAFGGNRFTLRADGSVSEAEMLQQRRWRSRLLRPSMAQRRREQRRNTRLVQGTSGCEAHYPGAGILAYLRAPDVKN